MGRLVTYHVTDIRHECDTTPHLVTRCDISYLGSVRLSMLHNQVYDLNQILITDLEFLQTQQLSGITCCSSKKHRQLFMLYFYHVRTSLWVTAYRRNVILSSKIITNNWVYVTCLSTRFYGFRIFRP